MWRTLATVLLHLTLITGIFALDLQPHAGGSTEENNCPDEDSDCVPFYLCSNGTINTSGEGIIDIRKNKGPCNDYMIICCKKNDQLSQPVTVTPLLAPLPKGCGYRHPNGAGFEITGYISESQFGEFPWMTAVFRDVDDPSIPIEFSCGGALIHPQAVITSAHCVSNKDNSFSIRVGEWDSRRSDELYPHQDRKVASVTIHPEFYSGALFNDIAFLFLESPVTIEEHIDVICLPPQGVVVDAGRCYSTGWGKDKFENEGAYQAILKKIDLPLVPSGICEENLRKTRLGKYFELHRSFLCAGGEKDKDACTGDGGSPLVCPIEGQENRYYHAGIVAWGIGCGQEDIPGVYANVAMFREWIDEQMSLNGLDSTGYQY